MVKVSRIFLPLFLIFSNFSLLAEGTIGSIVGEEDLPFTMDGTTPDIVINSLALP